MKVLILCMNYRPETTGIGPYTTGIAEGLAARGHAVTVLTAFPHYPAWRWQDGGRRLRAVDHENDVQVRRFRHLLPRRPTFAWRTLYDTSFAIGALISSIGAERPEVVLAVSPPVQGALAGAAISRAAGAPLVVAIQDLPLLAAQSVGMIRAGLATALAERVERAAYNAAQRIAVINAAFADYVSGRGVPGSAIVEIANWADLDRIRPEAPEDEMRAFLGAGERDWLVVHTGNIGEKQGLHGLLAAGTREPGGNPFALAIVGDGSQRAQLEELIRARPSGKVRLLPLQPSELYPRVLAAADALLLHQRAAVTDSVVPSKLLAYMAAGRPVIAAVNPESVVARLVRGAECGVVVAPESTEEVAKACAVLSRDADTARRLGASGRAYAERHFSKEAVLSAYEAVLESARSR